MRAVSKTSGVEINAISAVRVPSTRFGPSSLNMSVVSFALSVANHLDAQR